MLKIRLSRTGKKAQPSFRVVVQEHTAPIKGGFIEELGVFRPADNPKVLKINTDRVKYWISVGAKPSDTLAVLLKKEGMQGMEKYIEPRNKKRKSKKAAEAEAKAPASQPAAEAAKPADKPAEPAEPAPQS